MVTLFYFFLRLYLRFMLDKILEQLYHANQIEPIRNVVFMGMGEPLDNYSAVSAAIRGMIDVQRFSLKCDRVSISTVGVVPRLIQLAKEFPKVNLALSLHAPNQALRMKIVPSTKAWSSSYTLPTLFIVCGAIISVLMSCCVLREVGTGDSQPLP